MSTTYQQLEPVIMALDDRIKTNLGAFPTDTAEGSVASFADGADGLPLKSLVVDINPVQDTSSGDPSPENICPISGWTGVNVTRCGKNLFDKTATDIDNGYVEGKYISDSGSVALSSSYNVSEYIAIKGNATYTLSGISGTNPSLVFYDSEKQYISGIKYNYNNPLTFVAPNTAEYIRMSIPVANIDVFQLELGSTATPYEPYNGQTIPINWQTEAGTVYGGHLDVLSGVLTVDRAMVTLDGTTGKNMTGMWTDRNNNDASVFYRSIANSLRIDAMCDKLVYTHTLNYTNVPPYYHAITSGSSGTYSISLPYTVASSVAEANAWLVDNPCTICHKLATPIEIQLTPHGVDSLYGQNNVFADTGDCSVEYRADTKLYIERLTEPDADMIADSNIVSGQYFMVGNKLYKATANIASGGQVIVGTNAIRKSLSEALNEINS